MRGADEERDLEIRRATDDDMPGIIGLAERALKWHVDDGTAAQFTWKHRANPFGASDVWLALADGRPVGLRCFLRWELTTHDGTVVRVARAVDTGTDPDHQRRGVFRRLSTVGLEALADDDVSFVFNFPNEQSRAANLALGWQVLGRLPVAARPTGPAGLAAALRARAPAERMPLPCAVGEPAAAVFADLRRAERLLAARPRPVGLATHRTPAYLAWRYGHAPLHYRVVESGAAAMVFHLRRRGPATELAICDTFAPAPEGRALRRALRTAARATGADYLLRLGTPGRVGLPGVGPVLAVRTVVRPAPTGRRAWDLTLGDIEGL
jgi:GNAT superfamily N-acetyltransferase